MAFKRKRDYEKEYAATHGTSEGKKDRAARNKDRREAEKKYGKKFMRGKEVDHINYNPQDHSSDNVRVVSKTFNRKRQPKRP